MRALPRAPRGPALLRRFLDRRGLSVTRFCEMYGLSRPHIHMVLAGARRRINVDLALDLAEATDGAVPVSAWRMRPVAKKSPGRANALDCGT